MAAAKRLAFAVYATDPETGESEWFSRGRSRSSIPERFRGELGDHLWEDDPDAVEPDAPAPPGGVTGQDPASVDRDGDGYEDGPDGEALIDGTVPEVEDRVGDDPALAQAALDAERAKDKPRTGLVETLERIAGGGSGS